MIRCYWVQLEFQKQLFLLPKESREVITWETLRFVILLERTFGYRKLRFHSCKLAFRPGISCNSKLLHFFLIYLTWENENAFKQHRNCFPQKNCNYKSQNQFVKFVLQRWINLAVSKYTIAVLQGNMVERFWKCILNLSSPKSDWSVISPHSFITQLSYESIENRQLRILPQNSQH